MRILSRSSLVTIAIFASLGASAVFAQEASTETTINGKPKSEKKKQGDGEYKTKASVEIGVRYRSVDGNENKYRSDLNYKSGFRLFDSTLLLETDNSDGKAFDSLLITGSGFGADPNGAVWFNGSKSEWFKIDSSYRRFQYFNRLQVFALDQHGRDTRRDMGDFDITFLPENDKVKVRLGYSFNTISGPGAFTYDFDRDEFPILGDIDSRAHDFRIGTDFRLAGFNVALTQGFRQFKDRSTFFIDSPQLGNNPNPRSSFSTFMREAPATGEVSYSQLSFNRSFQKVAALTGRFIYSDSRTKFSHTQSISGLDRFGNTIVSDSFVINGDADKPNTIGDVGVTFFVTDNFSISNTFGFNSYRITGTNTELNPVMKLSPGGVPIDSLSRLGVYRFTRFRRLINTLEGNVDVNRFFSFYLGYRFSDREVRLSHVDTDLIAQSQSAGTEDAGNTTHSVLAGFKAKPIPKKWTIFFDVEHGRADNVFTRLANYRATNLRVRNVIRPTDTFSINLSYQRKDNTNPSRNESIPTTEFSAEVQSDTIAASFNWNPNDDVAISGGYTRNQIDSEAGVIFPVQYRFRQGLSRYTLRSNFFHIDAWVRPHKRVSLFGSYRISKDTGDGFFFSSSPALIDSSYPISYQSPEARVIFNLHRNIDWNFGYQYYKYTETVLPAQNYNAHLPYTSLRIYFGRGR